MATETRKLDVVRPTHPSDQTGDPLPSAAQSAARRTQALVDDITNEALAAVRAQRDELDHLARTIEARRAALADAIQEHARLAGDALKAVEITVDTYASIRKDFADGLAPVPATVTAR